MNQLEISNLTKTIGSKTVLKNISFSITSGKIYGLVGKNGSGKTMLIRSVSGLMKPTSGFIKWNSSILYQDIDFIPSIGIIIENIGLCQQFSGYENLKLLSNIKKKSTISEIAETLRRVGLDPSDTRIVKKYSLGMKQKLVIAQALMEKPDLLLLDEPTNALDQESCTRIRKIISDEAKRGACILIASHNSTDIDVLCDRIYTIENGLITNCVEKTT